MNAMETVAWRIKYLRRLLALDLLFPSGDANRRLLEAILGPNQLELALPQWTCSKSGLQCHQSLIQLHGSRRHPHAPGVFRLPNRNISLLIPILIRTKTPIEPILHFSHLFLLAILPRLGLPRDAHPRMTLGPSTKSCGVLEPVTMSIYSWARAR